MSGLTTIYRASSPSRWAARQQTAAVRAQASSSRGQRMVHRWAVGVHQGAALGARLSSPLPHLLGTGSLPDPSRGLAAQSALPAHNSSEAPPGWLNQKLAAGLGLCSWPIVRHLAGAGAVVCSLLTGLLAVTVHGVAVSIGMLFGVFYGVALALVSVNSSCAPSLELVPRSAKDPRCAPSLLLFSCFPATSVESELCCNLLLLCLSKPSLEFFEFLFAGQPKRPKLCSQASLSRKLGVRIGTDLKVDSWRERIIRNNFEDYIHKLVKFSHEAADLNAHSVDLFELLQEHLFSVVGAVDSPQTLIKRLQTLRICCHPDNFNQSAGTSDHANNAVKKKMEFLFKHLGQLMDLVLEQPKFAERLCIKPNNRLQMWARELCFFLYRLVSRW
jgi:hypothetical protein